jgi:hypothetical protein
MKLSGQAITVFLTDEGKQVLALASVALPESNQLSVSIEETEDLGLWIRIPREDQMHFFLVRWEYVLGIDLQSGMGKLIGMRA